VSERHDPVRDRARRVRAVVLDVDGVLTDASLYYGRSGESVKRFSARDGFAVVTAQAEGIPVAILSGRMSPPLKARLHDLHIPADLVVQGSRDKAADIADLAARAGVGLDEVAFMGDDLPDLPALALVGLAACPADAAAEVRAACHLVCPSAGGNGAVRELIEAVLRARGRWDTLVVEWRGGSGRPPAPVKA